MIIRCFCGRKVGELEPDGTMSADIPAWRRIPTAEGGHAIARVGGSSTDEPTDIPKDAIGSLFICPRHGTLLGFWQDIARALRHGLDEWKAPRRGRAMVFRGPVEEVNTSARFDGDAVKVAVLGEGSLYLRRSTQL